MHMQKVVVTESWLIKLSRFGRADIIAINDVRITHQTMATQWHGGEMVYVYSCAAGTPPNHFILLTKIIGIFCLVNLLKITDLPV